jgi:16S rRNA (adenine1518-N6/adenine1519-N6)-dimethyltransferase
VSKPSPLDIHALLRRFDLHPRRSLGQNFLQDEQALKRILQAANLLPGDSVLEIGPGLGSLTRHLAGTAKQVTAVELDQRLFPALAEMLAAFPNVRLVHGDMLELDPAKLMPTPDYLVVANIPYYITSALLRHLLEHAPRPRAMVMTLQREVAARICAQPGEMSLLALGVQVYGKPSLKAQVPREAFYPVPKVDSSIVRIDLYHQPLIRGEALDRFFELARAGFGQKRKTLRNALAARLGRDRAEMLLAAAGIDPRRRAETLTLGEWTRLVSVSGDGRSRLD